LPDHRGDGRNMVTVGDSRHGTVIAGPFPNALVNSQARLALKAKNKDRRYCEAAANNSSTTILAVIELAAF
jgi:hypothetical protein